MQTKMRLLLLSIGLLGLAQTAQADVKLPALISEGMVLQQGVAVPLWGWADEGETVRATIQGQTATSTAKNGVWMLRLKPLKAGGPFTLTIEGKNKLELKNVLVGEVWICSGQSNMGWMLKQAENAETEIPESQLSDDSPVYGRAN